MGASASLCAALVVEFYVAPFDEYLKTFYAVLRLILIKILQIGDFFSRFLCSQTALKTEL
jgi:hypothetical protein